MRFKWSLNMRYYGCYFTHLVTIMTKNGSCLKGVIVVKERGNYQKKD